MAETAAQLSPPPFRLGADREADLIELLAARVESLVARFRLAKTELEQLRSELELKTRHVRELERALEATRVLRREAKRRVEGLIADVERLQRAQS